MKTQVAIVGAGPAGLVLARLLELRGIASVVLEARSRDAMMQQLEGQLREVANLGSAVLSARAEQTARVAQAAQANARRNEIEAAQERTTAQIRYFKSLMGQARYQEIAFREILDGMLAMQREAKIAGEDVPVTSQVLYFQDKALGIMNVTGPEWRKLTAEELRLLSTIANQVCIAIERALRASELEQVAQVQDYRTKHESEAVAFVGDGNNMVHSWMLAASLFGIDFRLATCGQRGPLELIEPLLVNKDRQVGEAAVRARDRKLAAVGLADTMRDVELDLVAVGQDLDRMAHVRIAVRSGLRQFDHRQLEDAALQRHRVDARLERAAFGALIAGGLDPGLGRKMDREGTVGVGVFHPLLDLGLALGHTAGQERKHQQRNHKGDQVHGLFSSR